MKKKEKKIKLCFVRFNIKKNSEKSYAIPDFPVHIKIKNLRGEKKNRLKREKLVRTGEDEGRGIQTDIGVHGATCRIASSVTVGNRTTEMGWSAGSSFTWPLEEWRCRVVSCTQN